MDVDAGCAEAVSPRLLSAADRTRSKRVSRRFDLKMSEFETADMFVENCEPTTARKSLTLSLKKRRGKSSVVPSAFPPDVPSGGPLAKRPRKALEPSNGRFSASSELDYGDMCVPFVPSNTKKNNDWAHNNFLLQKCLKLEYLKRLFRNVQATVH